MLEALGYAFVQKALFAGVSVSSACAFLGIFLVMRRHALFGDALSHIAFGGMAIGLLLGAYPLWTALVAAILGGLGLERLRRVPSVTGDAAVAILLVAGLGAGVIAASASGGLGIDIEGLLFGSILLVSDQDLASVIGISAVVGVVLCALRRQLLYMTFSAEQARVAGIPVERLGYVFIVLTSLTVIISIRLVGILLVSALIVLPAITAITLGRSFAGTAAIAVASGAASVVIGIAVSTAYGLAPSGTIALIGVAILVGAIAYRSAVGRRY